MQKMWAGLVTVLLLSLPSTTTAQTAAATCANPTSFQWAYNSLQQSPCQIANALGSVCSSASPFTLPALQVGFVYLGPTLAGANPCLCSTVFYSVLSACADCQGRNWQEWTAYDTNCSTIYPGLFPLPIPAGTAVPSYAYNDVVASNIFNATLAQFSSGPESTASSPTSTSSSQTSSSSGFTTSSPSTSSVSSKKSNAGAIAGGVIGGIVGLALIAGLVFFFLRRRRASHRAPSSTAAPPEQAFGTFSPPPMSFNATGVSSAPKLYDPSDPTTYPSSSGQFTTPSPPMDHHNQHMSPAFTGSTQPSLGPSIGPQSRYTGAPEL